jgi:stage II sporulation protein GA (sporulation sigma-E factor processing peptidase)
VVYTVYIDEIFAVNVIMNIMVLAVLNRVLSYKATKIRIAAGAFVGGVWACVSAAFPSMPGSVRFIGTYAAVSALMAASAYGLRTPKELLKAVAGIYLTSVVLGGVMLVIREQMLPRGFAGVRYRSVSLWLFMATGTAFFCYGLTGLFGNVLREAEKRNSLCTVRLKYDGREETAVGLIDTGNRLREPVTGRPVHVAEAALMMRLCPKVKGVIYVPYRSVGKKNGILAALLLDQLEIEQGGKTYILEKPLVAVLGQQLSPSGEYQVLVQKTREFY